LCPPFLSCDLLHTQALRRYNPNRDIVSKLIKENHLLLSVKRPYCISYSSPQIKICELAGQSIVNLDATSHRTREPAERSDMVSPEIKAEAQALINKEFRVLDKGFVRLVDFMGSDASIVQAARVSYGKGTKAISEDEALIRYLYRHRHTTPFEMVEFKFHVKLPIFVARQWIRHRTASVNEYSGRYSVMREEFFVPEVSDLRMQSKANRQGRDEKPVDSDTAEKFLASLKGTQADAYERYTSFVETGLARELCRIDLPLSVYTEWYWKMDLHNLLHFLDLRTSPLAQSEIRKYAEVMASIVKTVCPLAYRAFEDYRKHAITFSVPEQRALAQMLKQPRPDDEELLELGLGKREIDEFSDKLAEVARRASSGSQEGPS